MSELTTIARPYAKAAFDYAVVNKTLDKWEEMLSYLAEVAKQPKLASLLANDFTVSDQILPIFLELCGDKLDDKGINLLRVMTENKRLIFLPDVLKVFSSLKQCYEKVLEAHVYSAIALNEEQEAAIAEKIGQRLNKTVRIINIIDESIVAGLIIRAGDLVIDNSVSSQLNRLNNILQS